jgi:hypothetical protein
MSTHPLCNHQSQTEASKAGSSKAAKPRKAPIRQLITPSSAETARLHGHKTDIAGSRMFTSPMNVEKIVNALYQRETPSVNRRKSGQYQLKIEWGLPGAPIWARWTDANNG